MAVLGTVLGVAGTVLSGIGAIAGAQAQAGAAEAQAKERERRAQEERAASQRDAIRVDKEEQTLQSRLQARAAASGGGAADSTVARLSGGIAQEGAYQTAGAIYQGESKARVLEAQAEIDRMEARNARMAGFFRAGSTLLGGFSSLADGFRQNAPMQGQTRMYGRGGGLY